MSICLDYNITKAYISSRYKKHEDFMFKSKIERPKPLSKTPGSGAYEYVVLIAASFGHFDEARLDLL